MPHLFAHEGRVFSPDGIVPDTNPADVAAHNAAQNAAEIHGWRTAPPDRAFVYVNEADRTITTWQGTVIGKIVFYGRPYRAPAFGCFPSTRINIRFRTEEGIDYSGTYYQSSGNYARVRRCKGK